MKRLACALAGLLLLGSGAHAWKHGVLPSPGYDFTVDFNSASLGRWTDTSIGTVFNNAAVTGHYNQDDGVDYAWSVVDASGYPGSHGRALQDLLPYGDLGTAYYEGCVQTPVACPSGSFGAANTWAINLADTDTVNVSWQMLVVTGFDFRWIGGKAAPNLNYFLNNGTTYPTASDKLWWVADSNTSTCPRNTFPTTGACPTFWSAKYQSLAGSPSAQQNFSWYMSTNVWHTFKFQFHRGCPVDLGGCVDHSYINIYGPTSDGDDTQVLWLTYNPLSTEPNGDTTGYLPSFLMSSWFGGNQSNNACANAPGCAILYDNIRIWSGTGP